MVSHKKESESSLADELAAATAELKAAQEKLSALAEKAEEKLTEEDVSSNAVDEHIPAKAVDVSASSVAAEAPNFTQSAPVTPVGSQEPSSQYYNPPGGVYENPQPQASGAAAEANYSAAQQTPPQQPYYQQPYVQPVVSSSKDHVAAGLLAIFLGPLGIHKFYLGYNTSGFIMLAVSILGSVVTFGIAWAVMWVIAIIEGVLYLSKAQSEFERTYVFNKREWF